MNREGSISGRVLIGDGRRRQASPRTSGDLCAHAPSRTAARRVSGGRVAGQQGVGRGQLHRAGVRVREMMGFVELSSLAAPGFGLEGDFPRTSR